MDEWSVLRISYNTFIMKLRRLLIILGLLGLGVIIATNLGGVGKLTAAFRGVHWYVVALVVVMQLLSYWANAGFYQSFFRLTGREVDFRKLVEISLAINFANQAIPAGGVAGTTFLAEAVREEVPAGQATLSQIGRYIFTFLSYFAVLAIGFILLFFGGNIGRISVRFIILVMLILLVGAMVLILVFAERRRLEATIAPVVRFLNWFGRSIIRRDHDIVGRDSLERFLDEFYDAYHELARHRRNRLMLW